MKKFTFIIFLLVLFACQKDEFTLETNPGESSFSTDGQLTNLIKSIALHDGSFDDVVDRSNCFSINFPYQITLNNTLHTITENDDLSLFESGQNIRPLFPIQVTFSNHEQTQVENYEALLSLHNSCADGLLDNDFITCVDFVYNINLALFDASSETFSTITLNHDRKTFQSIQSFSQNTLAAIRYPIILEIHGSSSLSINSDEELKNVLLQYQTTCN